MRRRLLPSLLLATLVTVPLAACGSDGGDSSSASGKSYCDIVKEVDKDANLDAILEGDNPPTKEQIDTVAKVFGDMASAAPAEIKTELDAVAAFIKDDMSVIAELDTETTDPAKMAEMLEKLTPLMGKMEALEGQMDKVAEYTKTECGVDMNA